MANSIYRKNVGETRADALERTLKEIDIPQNVKNSEFRLKRGMVLLRKEINELKEEVLFLKDSIKLQRSSILLLVCTLVKLEEKAKEYINLPWYKKLFKL